MGTTMEAAVGILAVSRMCAGVHREVIRAGKRLETHVTSKWTLFGMGTPVSAEMFMTLKRFSAFVTPESALIG